MFLINALFAEGIGHNSKYKVNNVSLKQTVFFIIHTGMHYLPIKSLTKILF